MANPTDLTNKILQRIQEELAAHRSEFKDFKEELAAHRSEFKDFKKEVRSEFKDFRREVRQNFREVSRDIQELAVAVGEIREQVGSHEERLTTLEEDRP